MSNHSSGLVHCVFIYMGLVVRRNMKNLRRMSTDTAGIGVTSWMEGYQMRISQRMDLSL